MSNKIPRAIADLELQIATAIGVGDESFTLSSAVDDDGNALPAGIYCFTVDNGTSQKEYLLGQLNDANVTSVKSLSRRGVETTGALKKHRIGAPAIVTNFATIQRVADILRGQLTLDGGNPLSYETDPTLSDGKELATVQYVLDTVTGGSVAFNKQTVTGNAGATVAAGELIYLDESDQEWYKTDATDAAKLENVQLGIALGSGTDGVAITGGIHIAGVYTTTGLTAGATYHASDTPGAIATTAGTIPLIVGVALTTTTLFFFPRNKSTLTTREKAALAGGGDFGTPSTSNKFLTEEALPTEQFKSPTQQIFTASGTYTKPAGLKRAVVRLQALGGATPGGTSQASSGAGAGGYSEKAIAAASIGATETVTIEATTSFGSHLSATKGSDGTAGSVGTTEGGNGGNATGGDVNIPGGKGGSSQNGTASGDGGDSVLGKGGKGHYSSTPQKNGRNGSGYGGGASGGERSSGSYTGGTGAGGIIIVTEYYV